MSVSALTPAASPTPADFDDDASAPDAPSGTGGPAAPVGDADQSFTQTLIAGGKGAALGTVGAGCLIGFVGLPIVPVLPVLLAGAGVGGLAAVVYSNHDAGESLGDVAGDLKRQAGDAVDWVRHDAASDLSRTAGRAVDWVRRDAADDLKRVTVEAAVWLRNGSSRS